MFKPYCPTKTVKKTKPIKSPHPSLNDSLILESRLLNVRAWLVDRSVNAKRLE